MASKTVYPNLVETLLRLRDVRRSLATNPAESPYGACLEAELMLAQLVEDARSGTWPADSRPAPVRIEAPGPPLPTCWDEREASLTRVHHDLEALAQRLSRRPTGACKRLEPLLSAVTRAAEAARRRGHRRAPLRS